MADRIDIEGNAARAKLEGRKRIFEQGIEMLRITGGAGRSGLRAGIKSAMPMLEVYTAMRVSDVQISQDDVTGEPPKQFLDLTPEQAEIVKLAGTKAATEMLEIASITHPVYEGATPYSAFSIDGKRQAPHMQHLFSMYSAGKDYFNFADDEVPVLYPDNSDAPFNEQNSVAYVAVAPGEFVQSPGPLTPTMMRRAAMRQRSYTNPEPAMLANNTQPVSQPLEAGYASQSMTSAQVVPISAGRQAFSRDRYTSAPTHAAPQQTCGCGGGGGCGCSGGHDCGCGCGGGHAHRGFAPARYKSDGTCESIGDISCDTRWRIRECFKIAFCDMLRCLADEVCEDGRLVDDPDAGACLEGFVCSLLHCLPDAICPPPEKETCCAPDPEPSCNCNFAVGE